MAELFRIGDRVRARRIDPPHHTRLPRYARGAAGTVTDLLGHYPLPDRSARRLTAEPEPVYAVAFAAGELFGEGDHTVTIDLWESYLQPAAEEPRGADTAAATGLSARLRRDAPRGRP
jgi:Nitrile hydratase beta subunit, C-terminal